MASHQTILLRADGIVGKICQDLRAHVKKAKTDSSLCSRITYAVSLMGWSLQSEPPSSSPQDSSLLRTVQRYSQDSYLLRRWEMTIVLYIQGPKKSWHASYNSVSFLTQKNACSKRLLSWLRIIMITYHYWACVLHTWTCLILIVILGGAVILMLRYEKWGTVWLNDLLKVTQQVMIWLEFQPRKTVPELELRTATNRILNEVVIVVFK